MAFKQPSEGQTSAEPFGKQLLNHVVDDLARTRPSAVWTEMPMSITSYEPGFRKITYRMLANSINGVAWWLQKTLGPGQDFETLAYFGPWDIRYILLLLGAVKAGYKMVFPSPGYSIAGLAVLLDETDCKTILAPSTSPEIVSKFLALHPHNLVRVQEVENILAKDHLHFDFNKSFEDARREPLVVLHTSGTTGHPKPVIWTHDYAASFIQQNQFAPPKGQVSSYSYFVGNRFIPILPVHHGGSVVANMLIAIPNRTTTIYPLPSAPLNADTLVDVLRHVDANCAIVPPDVAQQIATDPVKLNFVFTKLDTLGWSGGKLLQTTGDTLARRGYLFPAYGTTESGLSLTLRSPATSTPDNWACMEFHAKAGYEFRHVDDDCFEAIIIRNTNVEEEQPIFKIFPQINEWSTKDLFTPHPTIPGVWNLKSRADDVIDFADGTSFNPLEYEQTITKHSSVRSALMLGSQRPHACLLVELQQPQDSAEVEMPIDLGALWSLISQANERCTRQSIILKAFVLFTQPHKPLPRTPKGTVQRSDAMRLYADELETLYKTA